MSNLFNGQLFTSCTRNVSNSIRELVQAQLYDLLKSEFLAGFIERFLDLLLELVPVPPPHCWVLKVLYQWHRTLEGFDAVLEMITDSPVFVLK